MPSKRSPSAVAEPSITNAIDVPWIHRDLAASAIAAGGAGGLLLIPVSDLANDPSNVRRHGEKNHEATRSSLRKFGQRTPIVVQKQGMIVRAGNDRLTIFREENWSHIVALVVDENDVEATAYAIADNRTGELAEWDDEALARQLDALQKEGIDLEGLGFDLDDLDELDLGDDGPDPDLDDNGPEEPPVNPVSKQGDLWVLGDHRLLCGDSTNQDDVSRVLAGDKPPLFSTDPPYCVNYTGKDRPIHDGKPSGKDWSHVYREVDIKDLGEFLDGVLSACLPFVAENAPVYMWHAHVQQPTIAAAFERHDLLLHQVVIWVKPCAVFGHSYFRWRHEPCAFGWRKGHKPTHGTAQLDTVWEVDWEGKARVVGNEHPCLHPDALVLTEVGYRSIRSIQVDERVLAADGAFHTVMDVSAHAYQSPELIQIVAKGGSVPTLASDNHPFLIWRSERGAEIASGAATWVRADEILIGDYTMTPVSDQQVDYAIDLAVLAREQVATRVDHEGTSFLVRRVESIDRVPYEGDVWNLSVEGNPTFQTAVGMSHNTQKPLRLFEIPMELHTKRGDPVFEPFSGSGSQMMAAEKLGRRCRAIDLSPAFIDAAIRRWQKATGRSAVLDGDGRTYDEVMAERLPPVTGESSDDHGE